MDLNQDDLSPEEELVQALLYCSRVIVCVFWKNAIVVENHYSARC